MDPRIVIYGTEFCSYCTAARMLLKKKGLDYQDVLVSGDELQFAESALNIERLVGRFVTGEAGGDE